jgi:hypothetical protein
MGAIEVICALNDGSVKTRNPLEVVIWANEEGHHFGLGTLGSGVRSVACPLGPDPAWPGPGSIWVIKLPAATVAVDTGLQYLAGDLYT